MIFFLMSQVRIDNRYQKCIDYQGGVIQDVYVILR